MTIESTIAFNIIAKVHSPYKQKFAIPRQPNLVSAAQGKIELLLDGPQQDLVRDIQQHSHLWVLFVFHGTMAHGWKPLVKAPRLGGNKKTGVLATRSTFRPNPVGMSVVKLQGVSQINGNVCLEISGLDLLDGTPVIDIKPYIPYSDSLIQAQSDMAPSQQNSDLTVSFSEQARNQLATLDKHYPNLALFISQVLQQDPRPAYKKQDESLQEYGMSLYDLNIRWQTKASQCQVVSIDKTDKQ